MCGFIGGVFRTPKIDLMHQALALLEHRGPDSSAISEHKVGASVMYLAHARFSFHRIFWIICALDNVQKIIFMLSFFNKFFSYRLQHAYVS